MAISIEQDANVKLKKAMFTSTENGSQSNIPIFTATMFITNEKINFSNFNYWFD